MNKLEDIINSIIAREDKIINSIAIESVDVYEFLQDEFAKGSVLTNYLFQFVYRSFYRLDSAGLTDTFKNEYFSLMEESRKLEKVEPERIVRHLYDFKTLKDKNSVQFSFTTKLMSTIDCECPIYDSEVARVFGFSTYYLKDYDKKMLRYEENYKIITEAYGYIIQNELLKSVIKKFDDRFGKRKISNTKKIDFIFWSFGRLLRTT